MINKLKKLIGYRHSHLCSSIKIDDDYSWIEDVWSCFGFTLVRWQNIKDAFSFSSAPIPRYIYRLKYKNSDWELILNKGICD